MPKTDSERLQDIIDYCEMEISVSGHTYGDFHAVSIYEKILALIQTK
jgi:hypothetical protein